MARYIGPKVRLMRRFGEPIFGATPKTKYLERRPYPPGQHGRLRKRRVKSEYGRQLEEKQKLKFTYGVSEKQLKRYYDEAARRHGVTGEIMLQLLESRLDNVVYRLGLAPSRAAARQMISHKHITVNGKVVNIPSYLVEPGDIIGVRKKSQNLKIIQESAAVKTGRSHYEWLEWDNSTLSGVFKDYPEREEIPENVNEHLIVEWYSKR